MTGPNLRIERTRWGDPGFAACKRIEYEVFGIANDFTTEADDEAGEMTAYRTWERSSEFYVAYAADPDAADTGAAEPVAVVRMLRHDPTLGLDSFSTLRDFRCHRPNGGPEQNHLFPEWEEFFAHADPRQIAELATQAVAPAHRRAGVIERLWRHIIEVGSAEDVRMWTMALVVPLFRWYRAMLPDAVVAIGRVIPDYVGADSIPALVKLDHASMTAALARYDVEDPGASLARVSAKEDRKVLV